MSTPIVTMGTPTQFKLVSLTAILSWGLGSKGRRVSRRFGSVDSVEQKMSTQQTNIIDFLIFRCGRCEVCHKLWLPQQFRGLHPPYRAHRPLSRHGHRVRVLHREQRQAGVCAGQCAKGGEPGRASTPRRDSRHGNLRWDFTYSIKCSIKRIGGLT